MRNNYFIALLKVPNIHHKLKKNENLVPTAIQREKEIIIKFHPLFVFDAGLLPLISVH